METTFAAGSEAVELFYEVSWNLEVSWSASRYTEDRTPHYLPALRVCLDRSDTQSAHRADTLADS